MNTPLRPQLYGLFAGLALAAALCFSALAGTQAWIRLKESQLIKVTGSARQDIRSDLAVWTASLQAEGASLPEAQEKFARDLARVREFLASRGIEAVAYSPVSVKPLALPGKDEDAGAVHPTVGYRLQQLIQVSSSDVDSLPRIASDSLGLLGSDVVFQTTEIEFIYTNAAEAKVAMMAEATRDARMRADQIARQGARTIKQLHTAKAGVVQINPRYSTETSWEGNNDRTAIDKTISVTVAAEFQLH